MGLEGTPPTGVRAATASGVRAGNVVARFDNNNPDPAHHFDVLSLTWPTVGTGYADEIFVQGWEKIEEGTNVSACPGNPNLKDIWVYRDAVHNTHNGDPRSDIFHGSNSCGTSSTDSGNTTGVGGNYSNVSAMCDASAGYHYTMSRMAPGTWVRMSNYYKQNTDGTGAFQQSQIPWVWRSGDPTYNSTGEMMRLDCSGNIGALQPWDTVGINAYARYDAGAPSVFQWDDVYVAIGSGARARVEIMSARTWGDRAHRLDMNATLCTPTSWSATSVTCTVRQGSFANGQTAYLFVVDAAGNVSDQDPAAAGAQGFSVQIGGSSSDTTPPAAPSGLRLQP